MYGVLISRLVDQQAEKIKLTRQEHRRITHHFRGNLAELTHRMSGIDKALQDTRELSHDAKGKLEKTKVRVDVSSKVQIH